VSNAPRWFIFQNPVIYIFYHSAYTESQYNIDRICDPLSKTPLFLAKNILPIKMHRSEIIIIRMSQKIYARFNGFDIEQSIAQANKN